MEQRAEAEDVRGRPALG